MIASEVPLVTLNWGSFVWLFPDKGNCKDASQDLCPVNLRKLEYVFLNSHMPGWHSADSLHLFAVGRLATQRWSHKKRWWQGTEESTKGSSALGSPLTGINFSMRGKGKNLTLNSPLSHSCPHKAMGVAYCSQGWQLLRASIKSSSYNVCN